MIFHNSSKRSQSLSVYCGITFSVYDWVYCLLLCGVDYSTVVCAQWYTNETKSAWDSFYAGALSGGLGSVLVNSGAMQKKSFVAGTAVSGQSASERSFRMSFLIRTRILSDGTPEYILKTSSTLTF